MDNNEKKEKRINIKTLREKTGCSLFYCKKAIEFCQKYPECNEIGYLKAVSLALATPKFNFLERVRYFSQYEKEI